MASKRVIELGDGFLSADTSHRSSLVTSPQNRYSKSMFGQEHELIASIQELQRKLSMIQTTDRPDDPVVDNKHRLIMVSNRLPVSVKKDPTTGECSYTMSSGGLVSALAGIRDEVPFVWIGWLGFEIPVEEQPKVQEQLMKEYNCMPVFLTEKIATPYYNDFSNNVLWPIFHYVPLPMFRAGSEKKFDYSLWDAYHTANVHFAQVIKSIYRPGDYVWIHDYHLMVLPSLLRKQLPSCKIGWFLHTPFPSSEIYRGLPVRKRILEGLLGADLVGFHTYDYARHFLSACTRILGARTTPKGMELENHFTTVGVFPIGIEPSAFTDKLQLDETKERIEELCATFQGKKIIIGVDRLDYIKGMPHKLLATEKLLKTHPEWRDKVILIQIGVPSRTGVEEYQHLASRVNQLTGRINGTYGTLQHMPIHYINQSVKPHELAALYNIADVCFVSSIRDGMNLVSHEYVACQQQPCAHRDGPGVLVLSEFAGSAQSLSGAVRINPWNTNEMASALHQALTMSCTERELRHLKLFRYITTHSASFWARSFLADFRLACKRSESITKLLKLPSQRTVQDYTNSKHRVIICDYDGTLSSWQTLPLMAAPNGYLKNMLNILSSDPKNTVVIVSGRERSVLQTWFKDVGVGLAAESGFYYKMKEDEDWIAMGENVDASWKNEVRPVMQYFTDRTPGSFIEEKETAFTWHYCDTDAEFGPMQARDMQVHLEDALSSLPLDVVQGANNVEVRLQGTSKGSIVEAVLNREAENGEIDFVLCVGDDQTDEAMFSTIRDMSTSTKVLAEKSCVYTCHIGTDRSAAQYFLQNIMDLRRLLRGLATISKRG